MVKLINPVNLGLTKFLVNLDIFTMVKLINPVNED
jgi:hypothetical protein